MVSEAYFRRFICIFEPVLTHMLMFLAFQPEWTYSINTGIIKDPGFAEFEGESSTDSEVTSNDTAVELDFYS